MNRIMKKIMPLMLLFLFIFSSVVYASTTPQASTSIGSDWNSVVGLNQDEKSYLNSMGIKIRFFVLI